MMKLYGDAAVLLIIGAAVIGPFESKRVLKSETTNASAAECLALAVDTGFANRPHGFYKVQGKDDEETLRLSTAHWKKRCAATRVYGYETTAETCARVMKEIGAEEGQIYRSNVYDEPHKWIPSGEWTLNFMRVSCFPAPK